MNSDKTDTIESTKLPESPSMISRKQWLILLVFYILYLFLGGGVFLVTERGFEIENLKKLHMEQRKLTSALSLIQDTELRKEIKKVIRNLEEITQINLLLPDSFKDLVARQLMILKEKEQVSINIIGTDFNETDLNDTDVMLANKFSLLQSVYVADDNGTDNQTIFEQLWQDTDVDEALVEEEAQWTMYNSFFFSFQTITTIGFGKLAPKTDPGKAFFLAYSLFGVAFNGILFAGLADLFSKKFVKKIDNKRYESKPFIVLDAVLYLIPGIVIFFIVPAFIFMVVEAWDFLSSIYYVFVTLTTIGFGDMVSGYVHLSTTLLWIYRIFIHAWILFGLGYLLMIITFIQQALRSKQIRKLDKKMAKLLRERTRKSPANVQNDLNKLRSVLKAINIYKEGIDNVIEEKENNNIELPKILVEDVLPGKINLGFEPDALMPRSPFPERKLSKEMDPIEIFLNIASTVLKESEKRELLERVSRADEEKRDAAHEKFTRTLKNKLGISCENIPAAMNEATIESDNKLDGKHELKLENAGKKMSIKRKLSTWTLNVLPTSISKADLSAGVEVDKDSSEDADDDDDDEVQNDPDKINDLGDLINKVEEIVTQEITETNERIRRSVSYDCVTTRSKPTFFME